MLTFKLPKLKKQEEECDAPICHNEGEEFPSRWERGIRIPVNQKILDALKVGNSATIKLTGKITELQSETRNDKERAYVEIEISEVVTDSKNEFDELADEE